MKQKPSSRTRRSCAVVEGLPTRNVPGVNGTLTHSASFSTSPTVSSRNRRVRSPQGSLLAMYRYLSRRFSLVKSCTQDRNRCSPSKLISPSAAISSSFLFPRA